MTSVSCSDLSRAAGETLHATASTVDRWLLLEVPGRWAADVSDAQGLAERGREAVASWLSGPGRRRTLFVRRPGRTTSEHTAFVVRAEESVATVRRLELPSLEALADVDLDDAGAIAAERIVLVCGHGSRDQCCARRGGAVYRALASDLGGEELWTSSHQGGHRFAANVVVLPSGLQFGRVEPEEAPTLVRRALEGTIDLERYRGRTCYTPAVQAAEHVLRTELGLVRIEDVRLAGADGSLVRFRERARIEHAVIVEEVQGPVVPASCGTTAEPQRAFVARLV